MFSVKSVDPMVFLVVEDKLAPTPATFLQGGPKNVITAGNGLTLCYIGNSTDVKLDAKKEEATLTRAKCRMRDLLGNNLGVHRISGTYRGKGSKLNIY